MDSDLKIIVSKVAELRLYEQGLTVDELIELAEEDTTDDAPPLKGDRLIMHCFWRSEEEADEPWMFHNDGAGTLTIDVAEFVEGDIMEDGPFAGMVVSIPVPKKATEH